uniref:SJCHGC09713 protein n=1 Tax=Schistosoma japonicum TaxID=6182 RepID=Q5BR26_SCHJA|nr:SJCHGC09713 protein [Schistosoma japonicum]
MKYLQCPEDKCEKQKTSLPKDVGIDIVEQKQEAAVDFQIKVDSYTVINDVLTSIAPMLKIPNNLIYTKSKENETQY